MFRRDLALIKPNLDLSTNTAESRDTAGTCIMLLLLQRVWGQYPITESIVLCFRAPPRQPRFVGNRTAMPTGVTHRNVDAIDRQCTCTTAYLRNTID